MAVVINSINPALGDSTKDVTLEVKGSGFTSNSRLYLVSPTTPPQTYTLGSLNLLDSFTLRGRIGSNTVPIGIYDVFVDNGLGDNFTLSQVYRSAPQLPEDPFTSMTFENMMAIAMQNINPTNNPSKYDIRPGQTIWNMVAPGIRVISDIYTHTLYSLLKLGFPQYAVGALLELHAEAFGVIKKYGTAATGVIKTTAPAGTVLPTGMMFATSIVPNSPTTAQTFSSVETVGKIQKNSVTGMVTASDANSITDNTKAFTTNEWSNGYVWIDTGTGSGQVRKIAGNTATQISPTTPWTTGQIPDATSHYQLFSGVDVVADIIGSDGNVPAGSINRLTSSTAFITAVTNPVAFVNGVDVESDADLLSRLLLTTRNPSSGGNQNDYVQWAEETPGVSLGSVSVIPLWAGNGTVKVVIVNEDNTVPGAAIISSVQNYIDPVAGQGLGKAPIGHIATVVAATPVGIDVSVAITVSAGYTPVTVRSQVQTAIAAYLNGIQTGKNVLYTGVQNAILNSIQDVDGNWIRNLGVADYDIQSGGHGIKRSTSGTWTTANIVMAGDEKPISGAITVT